MMLETEARKKIYSFILSSPGSHLRDMGRRLNISLGHLRYHLDQLERNGRIVSRKDGYYRRYFATRSLDPALESTLCALRKKTTRRILLHLLNVPGATNTDIAATINLRPATVSLYLKELVEREVIERTRDGRESRYNIKDEQRFVYALKNYKLSFFNGLVDAALEIYKESHV